MYVQAIKVNKKRFFFVVLAAAILIATVLLGNSLLRADVSAMKLTGIKSEADRVKFLSSIGITAKPNPVDNSKIKIPEKFDLVYENYNTLQKHNGFDLAEYRGKSVDKWTYEATDFEGVQNEKVYVTLLIYHNKIIGGDISTARIDGFMVGLAGKE